MVHETLVAYAEKRTDQVAAPIRPGSLSSVAALALDEGLIDWKEWASQDVAAIRMRCLSCLAMRKA